MIFFKKTNDKWYCNKKSLNFNIKYIINKQRIFQNLNLNHIILATSKMINNENK